MKKAKTKDHSTKTEKQTLAKNSRWRHSLKPLLHIVDETSLCYTDLEEYLSNMLGKNLFAASLALTMSVEQVNGFGVSPGRFRFGENIASVTMLHNSPEENDLLSSDPSRRRVLANGMAMGGALLVAGSIQAEKASAAVGELPEFSETNAVLQGLTINVADQSQQKSMIEFLVGGLGFEVLRQRIRGPIEETVRSA